MEKAMPVTDRERMRQTDALEQRILQVICRSFGHAPFELEHFLQQVPFDTAPAEWHAGLITLCRKQIVRMMRKTWGDRLFQIPVQIYYEQARSSGALLSRLISRSSDDTEIGAYTNRGMAEYVLALLLETDREPLQLTQKGELHKRSIERVASGWGSNPSISDDAARGQLLLETVDLALRTGLARREKAFIKIDEPRMAAWLKLDNQIREDQLYMIWYRVHYPDHPALQWAAAALRGLPDERWIPVAALLDTIEAQEMRVSAQELDGWLGRLYRAGWIELGTDESGGRWVRKKPCVEEGQRTIIVQQDYEIIALPNTSFACIRALHQIAESLSWEGLLRYRLSAKSLYRAFDRGWDAASVIHFLQKHAVDEVSAQITSSIKQWETSRGSVRIVRGVVLQASRERTASMLQLAEDLKLVPLSDQYWLAEGLTEQELTEHLERAGLSVASYRASGITEATDTDDTELDQQVDLPAADPEIFVKEALLPQTPGLFVPRDAACLYRTETPATLQEELFPDYKQIPAIWYEQYRRYHPSTVKHIIQQAIRWRTGVRMRASDQDHDFVPQALEETGGACLIRGYSGSKHMRLQLHEVERLKLLMPGLLE